MPRRNPPLPPAPPKRRFQGAPVTTQRDRNALARVRSMANSLDERDRPFSPERPGTWRGSSKDLVVNKRRGSMTPNGYDLSFSPEFFFAEGEPYDGGPELPARRPISVWSAIETLRLSNPEEWAELAHEVFGLKNPDHLTPEAVLEKVQETNTCANLSSPVRVYIDPEGNFQLRVYEEEHERNGRPRRHARNSGSMTVKGVRLDPFTVAFLEAALWSSNDESRDDGGDPLDQNYGIGDFTQESLRELADDCAKFQEENAEDLQVGDDEQAGHDFWLNRNRHGAGFWDGDWPEPQASRLDKASKNFGEVNLYVTDGGEVAADFMRPTHRRNGEQQLMPWGSRRPGKFEIPMPDFDWEQVDGDVNLPAHGGIIARCEGGQIDLVEIQPVRAYVGDGEAAEVGYPFWTKEASFDADSLDPSNPEVRKALQSSDVDLDEIDDEHLATAIAIALMRYGHSEEGNGGWAADKKPGEEGMARVLGTSKVRWGYAGIKRTTFIEEAADEDDEFRREVLGEEDEDEE